MTFTDLNLNKFLHRALDDLGLESPTVIQEKVCAPVMAGKDIVGIAQTGTGKTFAYLLPPSLSLWKFNKAGLPQILIVVPTRELVAQVVEEGKLTVYDEC
ncbi:MAG: DEAD/DEAH box helicase [Chitinophagales bacterium]